MKRDAALGRGARLRRAAVSLGERLEAGAVLLVLLIAGSVWAFVELADEVLEGETAAIDRAVLLLLRTPGDPADPLGPPWVEEIGRDVTALGGIAVLTLLTLVVAAFLALRRMRGAAWLLLLATGSGMLASFVLKDLFDRPRPDLVPHGAHVVSASFPSGHSMMAAIVYLTLGALLARVQPQRRIKAFVLSVSILLAVLVGISRVYLGVHWPTDVLAGWTVGAAWALMFWLLARWLQRKGQVEVGEPE
ncbi:hypothetical protein DFH01_09345 [Falsiroseomonas bella]|uniref:Phosphatidic acid phosphatase type 2/haloperoxidase domain-containing protein n=2 Tax=Falsiroseomonas bella TaxID=2184016 RepID=A0A317FDA8_9PROT|nr:hypothetical protein DFH01_09345 [Falsiroseomonas bella]